MKGKLKRRKGHFKQGHEPNTTGIKTFNGSKYKDLKTTYIRLKQITFDKVKSIPRSVKQFTANDERLKYCDTPVLLRPQNNSSNLDPTNIKKDNTAR